MQILGEPGALVRLWYRKFGDVLSGETHGARKWDVTGRTGAVRRGQVRSLNLMAVEAALHHGQANFHPLAAEGVA